jgi:type III restriction enzyme
MENQFFERPVLNSPYEYPLKHWELDQGQPTGKINEFRRHADFITPIPKPRKQRIATQAELNLGQADQISTDGQQYNMQAVINDVRRNVDEWRKLEKKDWKVTPETARLLEHWRHFRYAGVRPFFCQVEAVETLIWLTEVAPYSGKKDRLFLITSIGPTMTPIPH